MQRVTDLRREHDGLSVTLSDFGRVRARAVLLATGASYRRLGVPALEALNGAGVFYGGAASAAPAMAGRDVYVLGGANSAGQAALHLARYARRVTLVVRAPVTRRRDVALPGSPGGGGAKAGGTTRDRDRRGWRATGGSSSSCFAIERTEARRPSTPKRCSFMIGAHPHTEWLPPEVDRDSGGFVLTGADLRDDRDWPLERSPFPLETSMPGVFAAGDVRHGSVKRVASAVGEGSVAIELLHELFSADRLPRVLEEIPD